MTDPNTRATITRNAVALAVTALAWLALDYGTKIWADSHRVGELIGVGVPGVFDFRLVHNTGAAWGLFGDSTFALGIFALVFCCALLVVAHIRREKASLLEMIAYGLVLAGGIGNAIDRFASGYVVDFIQTTFIDFPVFNIADIGVTCGFALLVISLVLFDGAEKKQAPKEA